MTSDAGRCDAFASRPATTAHCAFRPKIGVRHQALVAALIDSQLAQELPLAMVGEKATLRGEAPPGHHRYLREAED
jgi:hypothetical protein